MEEIKSQGLKVIAISYDSVSVLEKFANDSKIHFPLLSDPGSNVIRAFRLVNRRAGSERNQGIAHPKTVIVDKDRKVVGILPATVRVRHTTKELLSKWAEVRPSE